MFLPEGIKVFFRLGDYPFKFFLLGICEPEVATDFMPEDMMQAGGALFVDFIFEISHRPQIAGGHTG